MIIDVQDMVLEYLKQRGYEGLCLDGCCCCEVNDLAPCGEMQADCRAGHKKPCDCGEGCDFHIGPTRDGGEA
jgi:hypothetical protein